MPPATARLSWWLSAMASSDFCTSSVNAFSAGRWRSAAAAYSSVGACQNCLTKPTARRNARVLARVGCCDHHRIGHQLPGLGL